MLKKLKSVFDTAFPSSQPARHIPEDFAVVPVVRGTWNGSGVQAGAMDRMPESTRPTLCPAPMLRSFDEEARRVHWSASAEAPQFSFF